MTMWFGALSEDAAAAAVAESAPPERLARRLALAAAALAPHLGDRLAFLLRVEADAAGLRARFRPEAAVEGDGTLTPVSALDVTTRRALRGAGGWAMGVSRRDALGGLATRAPYWREAVLAATAVDLVLSPCRGVAIDRGWLRLAPPDETPEARRAGLERARALVARIAEPARLCRDGAAAAPWPAAGSAWAKAA